jgi:hypothetical protein
MTTKLSSWRALWARKLDGLDETAGMNIYQLTPAEVPKSLVGIRTIDDSLSHEADYVFVDLTRTTKTDFISESGRMTVAGSRAHIGTVFIGPGNQVHLIWPMTIPLYRQVNPLTKGLRSYHYCQCFSAEQLSTLGQSAAQLTIC